MYENWTNEPAPLHNRCQKKKILETNNFLCDFFTVTHSISFFYSISLTRFGKIERHFVCPISTSNGKSLCPFSRPGNSWMDSAECQAVLISTATCGVWLFARFVINMRQNLCYCIINLEGTYISIIRLCMPCHTMSILWMKLYDDWWMVSPFRLRWCTIDFDVFFFVVIYA